MSTNGFRKMHEKRGHKEKGAGTIIASKYSNVIPNGCLIFECNTQT